MREEIKQFKEEMFPKAAFRFESEEPIESAADIQREVERYFKAEGKEITVLKTEPLPVVSVEGKTYIARSDCFVGFLGGGKGVDTPFPGKYYGGPRGGITGNYREIFLYPYEEGDESEA